MNLVGVFKKLSLHFFLIFLPAQGFSKYKMNHDNNSISEYVTLREMCYLGATFPWVEKYLAESTIVIPFL